MEPALALMKGERWQHDLGTHPGCREWTRTMEQTETLERFSRTEHTRCDECDEPMMPGYGCGKPYHAQPA